MILLNQLFNKDFKYKLLTFDELVINLDRLSRFKLPDLSFKRVFFDIINKCLISPKYSKNELESADFNLISHIVQKIWNDSVSKFSCQYPKAPDIALNTLRYLINYTFKNLNENTKILLNTDLLFSPVLKNINYDNAVYNLKFLIKADNEIKSIDNINLTNLKRIRNKYGLYYPLEKVLIVEGITEEILLPVFAEKINHNFSKEGIYILGAGGKSKSPALYLKLKEKLNLPLILLFDSDAFEICSNLNNILLKKDKYILIEKGEFEDILSPNLIKRTLNNQYQPASPLLIKDLKRYDKMCDNIEFFFKSRHLGEFKKSSFAKLLASNIKYHTDSSEDIKKILLSIL